MEAGSDALYASSIFDLVQSLGYSPLARLLALDSSSVLLPPFVERGPIAQTNQYLMHCFDLFSFIFRLAN